MLIFLLYYFAVYRKPYISLKFISVLAIILFISFINVWLGYDSKTLLIKQFSAFLFNGLAYYLLIKANKNDIDKLFRIYLKLAVIMALIGIFQEISFLVSFKYGYNYSYFIHKMQPAQVIWGMLPVSALLPEPAHFGAAMAPAMFVSVLAMIKKDYSFINRSAAILIIFSVLLSFSLVAYIGIVSALVMIMLNYQKARLVAVCTFILVFFSCFSYRYLPNIKVRVDDTLAVINHKIPLPDANLSTFTFYTNALVAYESLLRNPVFGSGLGSHKISYDYFNTQVINIYNFKKPLNKEDAGSLLLRLISETGLLGILMFFYFIARFYVSRRKDEYFWLISNSILCLVILNLLRMGNYFYGGFILFIWLYYFAFKAAAGTPSGTAHERT